MARRRPRSEDEETSYWLSYSDMMAALLLIFVLIIAFTMLKSKAQFEEKENELIEQQEIVEEQKEVMEKQQEQLDSIIGIKTEIIQALMKEFEGSDLSVLVDSKTGAITFDSSVLFDSGQYEIKESGKEFLEKFIPRYIGLLTSNEYKSYVSEIIIEGHTDTVGGYMSNLELSQKRALSVAKFCLADNNSMLPEAQVETLREIVTANGRSYSNPIYAADGTVDLEASRRVEFKFRLQDEDMVEQMIDILSDSKLGDEESDSTEAEAE